MSAGRIFTDGACLGNFGACPGGWAALIVVEGEEETIISGRDPATTNNVMELTAVIRALEALPAGLPATLFSDSEYVVKGITDWLPAWKARGWRTKARKPVANLALWQHLEALTAEREVTFQWIRGHSGHPENERVDGIAEAEAAAESGWTPAARFGFVSGEGRKGS